ncbi:hypothetical protein B0H14DRAFT_3518348 [Mycena olivaceomarginata]|nr:hypothetical protein B0H14DRAFT_3518348 [Mycena olivaceomarginata]
MLTPHNLASLLAPFSFFSVGVKAAPGGVASAVFNFDNMVPISLRGSICVVYVYVPFSDTNTAPFCVPKGSIDLTTFKGLVAACGTSILDPRIVSPSGVPA